MVIQAHAPPLRVYVVLSSSYRSLKNHQLFFVLFHIILHAVTLTIVLEVSVMGVKHLANVDLSCGATSIQWCRERVVGYETTTYFTPGSVSTKTTRSYQATTGKIRIHKPWGTENLKVYSSSSLYITSLPSLSSPLRTSMGSRPVSDQRKNDRWRRASVSTLRQRKLKLDGKTLRHRNSLDDEQLVGRKGSENEPPVRQRLEGIEWCNNVLITIVLLVCVTC